MKSNFRIDDIKLSQWIIILLTLFVGGYLLVNTPAVLFFITIFSLIMMFSIKSSDFRVSIVAFIVLFIPTTDYFPFLDFNSYLPINIGLPLNMYTITIGIVILATILEKIINKELFLINKEVFKFELIFGAYILVLIISLFNTTSVTAGLKDILRFISFTYLVFWVCISNIKSKESLLKLFKTLVIFVSILSLYGIVEFILGRNIYFEIFRGWGSTNFVYDGGKRVFSTLGHPNILASIISCIIPLNLSLIIESKDDKSIKLFVASTYINFIALVLTFSRASWLACAISVLVFVLIQKDKKKIKDILIKYFVPTFIVTAITSIGAIILSENVRYSLYYLIVTRLNIQNILNSGSFTYRSVKILTAKKIISQHPLIGVGYANYSNISDLPQYKYYLDTNVIKVLDNNYLTILVETGIFGFIAFASMFFDILKNARKSRYLKDGITCSILSILISAASFELFRITPISVVLWLIICMMFADIHIKNDNRKNNTRIGYLKEYYYKIKYFIK